MGLPGFTRYMLEKVQGDNLIFTMVLSFSTQQPKLIIDNPDFDISTPGQGLMTLNIHFWGDDAAQKQIKLLNTFNNPSKLQGYFHASLFLLI
jgi:hypothetical protein